MKFVYNIYVLIIILRSTWVVQNAADFTLDELTHLSRQLNPIECMRLLEAIYLAVPSGKEHRVRRKTPEKTSWVSKRGCLDELKSWNRQFRDETEPKARVVMILHLNALGRADLADYVRKNGKFLPVFGNVIKFNEKNDQESIKIAKHRIFKRHSNENRPGHRRHAKRVHSHRVKRARIPRRTNQYHNIRHSMISAISGEDVSNGGQAAPDRSQLEKWQNAISKNSLFIVIALGVVVIFICAIVLLVLRRSLRNSPCSGERSDLCPGNNTTREKGLQCIGCLHDSDDYETESNVASQISEIDIEGGSCIHSVGVDSRKSYSDTVLYNERIIEPRVSIEELRLLDEEPVIEVLKEPRLPNPCGCRPLESKICEPKPRKKKKKCKAKSKGETKTTKSYFKAMQEKILPRQRTKLKKDCTFDMKQFQDKILNILNQECGVCQCCNCTPHWEVDGSKLKNRSARQEEKPEKKACKKKQSRAIKSEKLSITNRCDNKVITTCQTSARRSSRKQGSDSAKKCKIKNTEKSEKFGSPPNETG